MQCPNCSSVTLKPTKLEQGLSAMGCSECGGASISLLYYREWAERTATEADPTDKSEITPVSVDDATDTYAGMTCPKCEKLMVKYRVSGSNNNRLDLCSHCDEAWLDGGEWALLKALELAHQMPLIFTEAWQMKVRKQAMVTARKERLGKLVGEDDLKKAQAAREWLQSHPNKQEILFFINHQ